MSFRTEHRSTEVRAMRREKSLNKDCSFSDGEIRINLIKDFSLRFLSASLREKLVRNDTIC
jgi:hypothetical protein